jgi:hypothetical protein
VVEKLCGISPAIELAMNGGLDSTPYSLQHFRQDTITSSHHSSIDWWALLSTADQTTTMFARRISPSILRQTSARFTFNAGSVNYMTRCFGAAARKTSFEPSPEAENENMIRDYIKGLMDTRKQQEDQVVLKPISDEDLQQRLDHFQVCIM